MAQRIFLVDRRATLSDSAIVLPTTGVAQPEETRSRPVRTGDLLGDLAQRRIVRTRVFEAVFSDRDRVSAAMPLPHEACPLFQGACHLRVKNAHAIRPR